MVINEIQVWTQAGPFRVVRFSGSGNSSMVDVSPHNGSWPESLPSGAITELATCVELMNLHAPKRDAGNL